MTDRHTLRTTWLMQALNTQGVADDSTLTIETLPGDASFRNYFRIRTKHNNYLLMDAPPDLENTHSFVHIAKAYHTHTIRTPEIFAHNLEQGFLLLEDFGTQLLADVLQRENASVWYRLCYQELPKIQQCVQVQNHVLPSFIEDLLENELEQFKQWVVIQFAHIHFSHEEEQYWQNTVQQIKAVCAEQPQVGVHRDYHSRNLMILPPHTIGIIDFQDAVIGPLTYDLVSLLRDCYIDWPKDQVTGWRDDYYHTLSDTKAFSRDQFQRWFDWQGLQRHLKALFIFCRKYLRDGSPNYLSAIPRTLRYCIDESAPYPELAWLHHFLQNRLAEVLLERIKITID